MGVVYHVLSLLSDRCSGFKANISNFNSSKTREVASSDHHRKIRILIPPSISVYYSLLKQIMHVIVFFVQRDPYNIPVQ